MKVDRELVFEKLTAISNKYESLNALTNKEYAIWSVVKRYGETSEEAIKHFIIVLELLGILR